MQFAKERKKTPSISVPSDFRHIQHLGFNKESNQFDMMGLDKDMLQQFFKDSNLHNLLTSPEDAKFAIDFIAKNVDAREHLGFNKESNQFDMMGLDKDMLQQFFKDSNLHNLLTSPEDAKFAIDFIAKNVDAREHLGFNKESNQFDMMGLDKDMLQQFFKDSNLHNLLTSPEDAKFAIDFIAKNVDAREFNNAMKVRALQPAQSTGPTTASNRGAAPPVPPPHCAATTTATGASSATATSGTNASVAAAKIAGESRRLQADRGRRRKTHGRNNQNRNNNNTTRSPHLTSSPASSACSSPSPSSSPPPSRRPTGRQTGRTIRGATDRNGGQRQWSGNWCATRWTSPHSAGPDSPNKANWRRCSHSALKAEILRLNSVSDRQRYHQLIKEESLGDRKPSDLLRRMRSLLGDMQVDDKFVKEMFLERLPADVQTILASGSQDLTVSQLAEMADQMIEVQRFQSPSVAQISSSSSVNDQLVKQVSAMADEMASLKIQLARLTSSRSCSRRRSRSRPRTADTCWFHKNACKLAAESASVENRWCQLRDMVQSMALAVLGRARRQHQDWLDDNDAAISNLLAEKNRLHKAYVDHSTADNIAVLYRSRRHL
ncbi:hypothetical protein SprV_0100494000 [Sparganum proliferum]